MADIIDRAQANEDLFRREALQKHFGKRTRHTPGCAVIEKDCLDCGEPIPAKRLKANPQATRCVTCQTLAERRGFEDE
jgi:DnaK suppressor protein